jgi:uncharacterized protein (TIGR02596 family)
MNATRFSSRRRARRGFSLIELLAVMAIMAILLSVTIPSIEGLNQSVNIGQGGQLVMDQIALARQTAAARNITVELRCIKVPTRSANGYTAMQLWSKATIQPISRMADMPDGIAISQDTTNLSTLFGSYNSSGTMPAGVGSAAGDSYVSFTISPSGMVGPLSTAVVEPNMTALSIGVVPYLYATNTSLPKNYVLIQLNPLTAATIAYRP